MKKTSFLFLFLFFLAPIFSISIYKEEKTSIDLMFGSGITYNFLASTNNSYKEKYLFLEVPLNSEITFRINEYFSLGTGIELTYGIITYKKEFNEEYEKHYLNNLFIRIPFAIKLYPLVNISNNYDRFYIGFALFFHGWILNSYYVVLENSDSISGNCYHPTHENMPPSGVYTPVNIGFKFSIGNNFRVSNKTLIGLELLGSYLFLPVINGYYNNINYKESNVTIVEFVPSIGASVSIGVILFE